MSIDPEISKALNELVITLLGLITTVFIPWAFSLFRAWAKAKVDSTQNKELRDALEFGLKRLDSTAETVVTELNQTLRAAAGDGKLTKDEGKALLIRAYNRTLARLPADATAILQNAFGERLQAVVVGKIESKVAGSKPCAT